MKAKDFEQRFDEGGDLSFFGFIQSQACLAGEKTRKRRFSNLDGNYSGHYMQHAFLAPSPSGRGLG